MDQFAYFVHITRTRVGYDGGKAMRSGEDDGKGKDGEGKTGMRTEAEMGYVRRRAGAWYWTRDAPSFLSVVARHNSHSIRAVSETCSQESMAIAFNGYKDFRSQPGLRTIGQTSGEI